VGQAATGVVATGTSFFNGVTDLFGMAIPNWLLLGGVVGGILLARKRRR
jgi:Flp pilus assembly protein protease CpaA